MKLLGIILALVFLCSCAVTDKRNDNYYHSSDEAAEAAFDKLLRKSIRQDREYGGIIYRDDKGYFYTFTRGSANSGMLAFSPADFSADSVALWHTHGDSESGFSDMDIELSKRTCSPLYVMNKLGIMFTTDPCNFLAKN